MRGIMFWFSLMARGMLNRYFMLLGTFFFLGGGGGGGGNCRRDIHSYTERLKSIMVISAQVSCLNYLSVYSMNLSEPNYIFEAFTEF